MSYSALADRYDAASFRRCGQSGLDLPTVALGLWQNFGDVDPYETGRALIRRAFDRGITHFDFANNYGPPPGSAEFAFGRVLATDLRPYRDELVISTKAGYDMWAGRYGSWGSRKHLTASLDASLGRLGIPYVDIFYHHRPDPRTPLEETMGALASAVRAGKALYVGLSNYGPQATAEAAVILRQLGTPCLVHQPRYSMLDRTIEHGLLDTLQSHGIGCAVFSPLAQGLLTAKYLSGIPADARMSKGGTLKPDRLTPEIQRQIERLTGIAKSRGQSLTHMALNWALRDSRVTTAVVGARTIEQLDDLLNARAAPAFEAAELQAIEAALAG